MCQKPTVQHPSNPDGPDRGWGKGRCVGRRALCVPPCPPGWQCCSLRGWAPRDCPKERWCSLLHWRPQPRFWNGCLTLLGNEDWLRTQVTGRYFLVVTGKEQRAFLDVPVVMSCVSTKHKAFPSPAAWMFHFTSVFFVAGRVEGEQLRPTIFLVRDSLKKLVPWTTAVAFHILLHHLFGNISTQTDPLLGPLTCSWSSLQPKGCSHVAALTSPTQSQPSGQFHLLQYVYELKKPNYKWEMGFLLHSAL